MEIVRVNCFLYRGRIESRKKYIGYVFRTRNRISIMYIELDIEELEREHLDDIRLEEDEETFSIRGIGTFLLIPYNDDIWRLYFKDPSIPIHEKINTYIRVHREENSLVGIDPINEHRITHPNNPRLAAALLVPRAF